jgi:NTP pyrophosphatase (non-canonical NTP hydrolase)
MNLKEYQQKASRTINPDLDERSMKVNMTMGISGESGETIDMIKKEIFHGHDIDLGELKKEIGDILWYVAGLATAYDLDLDEIATLNIEKLKRRYPGGFSQELSKNRKE